MYESMSRFRVPRNKHHDVGPKSSKLRMTARNRLCFLVGAWEEEDQRCSGVASAGRFTVLRDARPP